MRIFLISKIICVSIIFEFVWITIIQAETFRVIIYEPGYPPYAFSEDSSETGVAKDVLLAIGKITGDKFEYEYVSVARGLVYFEENKVDIEPRINPIWRKNSSVPGVYTIPYSKSINILLFRPGKRISVKTANDLVGKEVGGIRGFVYPMLADAFSKGKIIREDSVALIHLLRKLEVGRIDQVIITKIYAQYWMKKNPNFRNFEIGDEISSLDVMLRLHPNKKHALKRFNIAIKQMIESGELEKIHARYR